MRIVESKVSAGDREIFDLDEFLSRPLYAHLAHDSGHGPRNSPVWFHGDGQAIWIIGGTSFPDSSIAREPQAVTDHSISRPRGDIVHDRTMFLCVLKIHAIVVAPPGP